MTAAAIGELGEQIGLLETAGRAADLHRRLPNASRRPSYSLLDCTATRTQLDLAPRHWRDALNDTYLHNKDGLHQLIKAAKT